jgi:hypothetical protein
VVLVAGEGSAKTWSKVAAAHQSAPPGNNRHGFEVNAQYRRRGLARPVGEVYFQPY